MKELRAKVEGLIADLLIKIKHSVPDEGSFPMVYSEFKNTDREMCLTDVMLKFQAIPEYLPDYKTERWLELVGYKLPVPYKTTMIIFKGTKKEIIEYLTQPESVEKILDAIPRLDYNLMDV
ncbi:MAG: hypothetical protein K2K97_04105 [Muribaculaceae bacterium]|nr:hypothetical protein [Muribaculaceae bacterium]